MLLPLGEEVLPSGLKHLNEIERWLFDYYNKRPHDSIGGMAPIGYANEIMIQKLKSKKKMNI
jgi:transposase InsO family protein